MWNLLVNYGLILTAGASAANVTDFEGLCELMVLEQFYSIKSIPLRVATYVSEQKANTALKAAEPGWLWRSLWCST